MHWPDPVSFGDYCKANWIGLAHSELQCILSSHANVTNYRFVCPRQDETPLCSVGAPACSENLFDVPKANISDPPLLVILLHAPRFSSVYNEFERTLMAESSRN